MNVLDGWTLFSNFILRDLGANKLRTTLTVCGIALGVAIVLAISLANDAALYKFKDSLNLVSGKSSLQVIPVSRPYIDESILAKLSFLWEKEVRFLPVLEEQVAFVAKKNNLAADKDVAVSKDNAKSAPVYMEVFAADMFGDVASRGDDWKMSAQPANRLDIFSPNACYITEHFAKKQSLGVGDSFTIMSGNKERILTVVGILEPKGLANAYGGNLLIMDLGVAQEVFGLAGKISRIEFVFPEDINLKTILQSDIAEQIRAVLPAKLLLQRPEQRGEQVDKMLRAFQLNLTALSFIAFLVGMFLIYNSMSISVLRRREEIGILRALGLKRIEVVLLFLAEASILGLLGTGLGVILGIVFAHYCILAVSSTMEALYVGQAVADVVLRLPVLFTVVAFGFVFTILAGLYPAIEASTVSPATASRRGSYEAKIERQSSKLLVFAALALLLSLILALMPAVNNLPVFGYASVLVLVIALSCLMPSVLVKSLIILQKLICKSFGVCGRIALASLSGSIGRCAVACASLMVGIAMMVSLSIMIGSFRDTVVSWVQQTLIADLYVKPASRLTRKDKSRLDSAFVESISNVSGVDAVGTFLEFPILLDGEPARLGAGDFAVLAKHGNLLFVDGRPASEVIGQAITQSGCVISECFATKRAIKTGQTISLTTPKGPLNLKVCGVYYDYASENGYIVLPRPLFNRYFDEDGYTTAGVYLSPGADLEKVRSEIIQLSNSLSDGESYGGKISIRTNREFRDIVFAIFERTFTVTYALHLIAVVVAILGIFNALISLVLESKRDFGLLKYLGAQSAQVKKIVAIQAGLLGFVGNLMGLAMGVLLSVLLVYVINKQSFGWTIQYAISYPYLLQVSLLVLIASLITSIYPAAVVAKMATPAALRQE